MVADAALGRLLHSPINRRIKAIARTTVDGALDTLELLNPPSASLMQGAPIGRVVRPFENPNRLMGACTVGRPAVEEPAPEMGAGSGEARSLPSKKGQDMDEVDRLEVRARVGQTGLRAAGSSIDGGVGETIMGPIGRAQGRLTARAVQAVSAT